MGDTERLPTSLLTGPTISVYIGSERKHWTLHRGLLAFHSSFFAQRPEVDNDKLEYPDDNAAGWSLLIRFLYQNCLPPMSDFRSTISKYEHAVACHALYVLCFRFSMPHLTNVAMDRFRQCLRAAHLVPDAEEIHEMYRTASEGSRMRSLMIRIAARQIMDPEVERDVQAYAGCFASSPEFAVGLVGEIRRLSGGILFGDPTSGETCEYHEHAKGEACRENAGEAHPGMQVAKRPAVGDMSTGNQSHEALLSKVPKPAPLTTKAASMPTKAESIGPKRTLHSPKKSTDPGKLNGTGLKIRFIDSPDNQSAETRAGSKPDAARHTRSPDSEITVSKVPKSPSTNERITGNKASPSRSRKSQRKQVPSPAAEGDPDGKNAGSSPSLQSQDVKRRPASCIASKGRVDGIVNRYDKLALNDSTLRLQGECAPKAPGRRRPPKLQQSLVGSAYNIRKRRSCLS